MRLSILSLIFESRSRRHIRLGRALVHHLHQEGAHVAFVARHRERVEEVAREHPARTASWPTSR